MKKLTMMMLAACAAAMMTTATGCRAVTVENYGEEIARDADEKPVTLADGRIQTVKKGWRVHHNQHWMNTKADSIEAHIKPEDISFAMNGLNTQPSEELSKMVGTSLDGLTKLAVAVGEAYVKIAGGGAQADTALNVAARVANYFRDKGDQGDRHHNRRQQGAGVGRLDVHQLRLGGQLHGLLPFFRRRQDLREPVNAFLCGETSY